MAKGGPGGCRTIFERLLTLPLARWLCHRGEMSEHGPVRSADDDGSPATKGKMRLTATRAIGNAILHEMRNSERHGLYQQYFP
jgi:hypothetical protein